MRALIVGAGAVGQFLAARLAQGGHEVVVMARPAQADALNALGITLDVGGCAFARHGASGGRYR